MASPGDVAAGPGEGGRPVPLTAVGGLSSGDRGCVSVFLVVGAGVDTAIVYTVCRSVGDEGSFSLCVVPGLLPAMAEESRVVTGMLVPRG